MRIALLLGALFAAPAAAAPGFYAGGTFHPLRIPTAAVVVRAAAGPGDAFSQLGARVVPRTSVAPSDQVLGLPVTFDAAGRAVGVLTPEIVVAASGARPARALQSLRETAGLLTAEPLPFGRGLYRARYATPEAALAAATALHGRPGIRYAHPNFLLPKVFRGAPRQPDAEPLFQSQWHLENTGQLGGTPGADIGARSAWDVTQGDPSVVIAVLDGGFDASHPDLALDTAHGWNFKTGNTDLTAGADEDHGTCVAGLVAAPVNGKGVTGVCPGCTVLPVVVAWTPVDDAAAFHYAVAHGASVITNSWGYAVGTPTTDVVAEAIADASSQGRGGKGAVVLFAMNNIDQDDCKGRTPDISSLPSVVAVSAANDQDQKVRSSGWGACLKLLGPSLEEGRAGITTTDVVGTRGYNNGHMPHDLPDVDYTNAFGGTSAATPIVAGVVGLMLSANPKLTRDEVVTLLLDSARKVHPELAGYDHVTGFSDHYGHGRVDAARAVQAAEAFRRESRRLRPLGPASSRLL